MRKKSLLQRPVALALGLCLCLCLLLQSSLVSAATQPSCLAGAARHDCGYWDADSCESNNCCWTPTDAALSNSNLTAEQLRNPPRHMLGGTPWCYVKQSIVGGYKVVGVTPRGPEASSNQQPGWTLQLALYDGNGYFGSDVPSLAVDISFETRHRLRVKITDPGSQRWEIPEDILPLAPSNSTLHVGDASYTVSWTTQPFGFAVTRRSDGSVIFNSTSPMDPSGNAPLFNGLIFTDQYLELSTQLPNKPNMYGLGEKVTTLQLATDGKPITFWARDAATPPNENIYGSHPFYLEHRISSNGKSGDGVPVSTSHGIWLRNSNGMDVILMGGDAAIRNWARSSGRSDAPQSVEEWKKQQLAMSQTDEQRRRIEDASFGYLTYRVIGGVLDFFIYVGDDADSSSTPNGIVTEYQRSVGLPHMPPLWSLGFHQCRWGYPSLQAVEDVVAKYAEAGLPLDTMWTDIDYMNQYEDFTTDPVNYPTAALASFVEKLHANGQQYVVIIDPAISNRSGYSVYEQGLKQKVFIKKANGEVFIGRVWPGFTAFPTFYANNTQHWWTDNIVGFRNQVPVDGLWIDMNEPSNFCNGDCDHPSGITGAVETTDASRHQPRIVLHEDSVFDSKASRRISPRRKLSSGSSSSSSSSVSSFNPNDPPYRIDNAANGSPLNTLTLDMDTIHGDSGYIEYNVHNMYGLSESMATKVALESTMNTRSFVLSRSTFSGSGHHTGHWLGDNWSTWDSMAASIPGLLAMNMFGIPLVGADICGFNGDTTEELCARWMAMGAFYPFSRNHNAKDPLSQEPYLWPSVTQVSKKVLLARYSLIHVYNTLFYQVHVSGGTVARPLFFNFPHDVSTLSMGDSFMLGDSILITPVLQQGKADVWGYWPQLDSNGRHQLWYDYWTRTPFQPGNNGWADLQVDLTHIPVHIRGGAILPLQQPALTLAAQRFHPFNLIVAPDVTGRASGSLFMDDGRQMDPTHANLLTAFTYANGSLQYTVQSDAYVDAQKMYIDDINVLGVNAAPSQVLVNGAAVKFDYDASTKVLDVAALNLPINKPFTMTVKP